MTTRRKPFANGELTIRQAADRLDFSIQYTYMLVWQKQLKARKEGKRWLIDEDSVRAREAILRKFKGERSARSNA